MTSFAPCPKRVCFRRFNCWKLKTPTPAASNSLSRERVLLLFCCILLSGCRSRQGAPAPSIKFTKVPSSDVGGPDKLDAIEGLAAGVQPGQQIVLYARSEEIWWVQPFSNRPFTKIQGDSKWKSETHLGTGYAALLVDQGYNPPQTAEALPAVGTGVLAVAVIKGQGPAPPSIPPKTLHFSGYEWTVRSAASNRGGSHNSFDPAMQ